MSSNIALSGHAYINLETYMRNGQAVRTPLELRPGKAKRLRDNSTVCVVSSGIRGQSKGEWLDGTATFTTLEKLKHALKHRNKSMGSRQG